MWARFPGLGWEERGTRHRGETLKEGDPQGVSQNELRKRLVQQFISTHPNLPFHPQAIRRRRRRFVYHADPQGVSQNELRKRLVPQFIHPNSPLHPQAIRGDDDDSSSSRSTLNVSCHIQPTFKIFLTFCPSPPTTQAQPHIPYHAAITQATLLPTTPIPPPS
jgi:hypothetical protein